MSRKKSKHEVSHETIRVLALRITFMFTSFFRYGSFSLIAFFFYKSVGLLAGQKTVIEAFVKGFAEIHADQWGCYALASLFGWQWWKDRKLRKDVVERVQGRVQSSEREIDPRRSSSGLTPRGDNPKGQT